MSRQLEPFKHKAVLINNEDVIKYKDALIRHPLIALLNNMTMIKAYCPKHIGQENYLRHVYELNIMAQMENLTQYTWNEMKCPHLLPAFNVLLAG